MSGDPETPGGGAEGRAAEGRRGDARAAERRPRDARPAAQPAEATFAKDFDALAVGERFRTEARTIEEADITSFAELTGDRHPQHVDADWAARSRFGERIAHGLLVLSYAAGLMPFDPDRVVALRKVGDATFKQPVRIGDTVHVEGEIAKTRELDDDHGLVETRWKVVNQDGKLVLRVTVEVVWRRGELAPAPESAEGQPVLL